MQKIIISVLVVAVLALGGWYFISSGGLDNATDNMTDNTTENANDPVAVVNGEELTRGDLNALETQIAASQGMDTSSLDAQAEAQLQQQALDTLVSQTLLRQQVQGSDTTVTDADIDEQLQTIQGQFESEAAFEEALTAQGVTRADLRTQVEQELATQAYLDQELGFDSLSATDEEIQSMYENSVAGSENAPALEEVRDQVEQLVIQQKQQQLVSELLEDLRSNAEIEILI